MIFKLSNAPHIFLLIFLSHSLPSFAKIQCKEILKTVNSNDSYEPRFVIPPKAGRDSARTDKTGDRWKRLKEILDGTDRNLEDLLHLRIVKSRNHDFAITTSPVTLSQWNKMAEFFPVQLKVNPNIDTYSIWRIPDIIAAKIDKPVDYVNASEAEESRSTSVLTFISLLNELAQKNDKRIYEIIENHVLGTIYDLPTFPEISATISSLNFNSNYVQYDNNTTHSRIPMVWGKEYGRQNSIFPQFRERNIYWEEPYGKVGARSNLDYSSSAGTYLILVARKQSEN